MLQKDRSPKCSEPSRFVCLIPIVWMGLATVSAYAQGDSYLDLGRSGYAMLPNSKVHDLDYTKDFTVEAVIKIEPAMGRGRWPYIVAKAVEGPGFVASAPGFALGLDQGHLPTYGQIIVAKVGDGTKHIFLTAREREGYAYAVMTWGATDRSLSLYVNGEIEAFEANAGIVPSRIKNTEPLGLGHATLYDPLGRDIMLARLWNRRLTADDVAQLWSQFASTGRHAIPEGFDRQQLHSEWLMHETADVPGEASVTHIRDSAGSNHLALYAGATLRCADGPLAATDPVDGQSGVHKAVELTVTGGRGALSGGITLPLQYFFEVDESPDFSTPALKESSWQAHYGRWSPILKPDTLYYWRARVRDASRPPKESAFTPVRSLSTEGPSTWYVRPRDRNVTYGAEDGTSYENAFNGLVNWDDDRGSLPGIVWGTQGVEAGDTLYVCDRHELISDDGDFADRAIICIGASGHSPDYPVTIRGDCPFHSGTIVGLDLGYRLKIDRRKHVLFQGIVFEGFNLRMEPHFPDGTDEAITDTPRSTYIVFDGCTMMYADCLVALDTGHDHWTFRNNTMMHAGSGILTGPIEGAIVNFLTVSNNTFRQFGVAPFEHTDAHAVGIGSGEGHVIEGNYIENTGTAIEFWTATLPMQNMIVRYNFIKDIKKKRITEGHGIAISGKNNDSFGLRTGFKIYGNIIVNPEGSGISSNNKDLVEVYNNVVCGGEFGLRFAVLDAPLTAKVYNNIIVDPKYSAFFVEADPNLPWSEVSWDHNIYWSSVGQMINFETVRTPKLGFKLHEDILGWDMNSIVADPRFVSLLRLLPEDFRLQAGSPAIDAGEDVGLARDFDGNPVPWGLAPDIGAYEYTSPMAP